MHMYMKSTFSSSKCWTVSSAMPLSFKNVYSDMVPRKSDKTAAYYPLRLFLT